jgi:hypothetical protein
MRRLGLIFFAAGIGLASLTAACSNSVSKEDFKKELDDAGLGASADTQCLVDKLAASGFQFRKYGDPTPDEQQQITDAATKCVKLDGVTPGSLDPSAAPSGTSG